MRSYKKNILHIGISFLFVLLGYFLGRAGLLDMEFILIPKENADLIDFGKHTAVPETDLQFCSDHAFSRHPSIIELKDEISKWKYSSSRLCRQMHNLVNNMIIITERYSRMELSHDMKVKLKTWLKDDDLVNHVERQQILLIKNKWTGEMTICNPFRDKRPLPSMKKDHKRLEQMSLETQKVCDFCNFSKNTSPDPFGRMQTNYSYTASNIFRIDRWNSMVLLYTHHPTDWSREQIVDMFETATLWFSKVHAIDPDFKYPQIFWDLLPKAGGSQLHPHFHTIITPDSFYGQFDHLYQTANIYATKMSGRNYFDDLKTIHQALGLAISYGSATALVSLTPRKENEIIVLDKTPSHDFFTLIFYVARAYIEDMDKFSFSLAAIFPRMGKVSGLVMPAMARMVTRGLSVFEVRSDISSLELFAAPNVNVDPYKVASCIRSSLHRQTSR